MSGDRDSAPDGDWLGGGGNVVPWYLAGGGSGAPSPASSPDWTHPRPPAPAQPAAAQAAPVFSPPVQAESSGRHSAAPETPQVIAALPRPRTPESQAMAPVFAPPPPQVSTPRAARAPRSGVSPTVLYGALALVLLLAAGGGVGWFLHQRVTPAASSSSTNTAAGGGSAGTTAQAPSSPASPSTAAETPTQVTPTVSPEQAALTQLNTLRTQTLQGLNLDGRWVAQVASKSVGITDPLQTAQNGSHTFYAADILAEVTAVQARVNGSPLLVLTSQDFGKVSTAADAQPYWVTLVDGGFGSLDAVQAWCAATYADLSQAARDDTCAPRTLSPPHS